MLMLPSVDRLRFADLVAIARTSIPRRAPGWTNHNIADTGIALLDLGAWLAETTAFELDQVGDGLKAAFLELAGFSPAPAEVAETLLVLSAPLVWRELPPGLQVTGAGGIAFQTAEPAWLPGAALVGWDASGSQPSSDVLLALAFDARPAPAGSPFRIAVWTDRPEADQALRRELALVEQEGAGIHWCGGEAAGPFAADRHYGVALAWEYLGADGDWRAARMVEDGTRALSLSGAIVLEGPPDAGAEAAGPDGDGLFRFRCRAGSGRHDVPLWIAQVALGAVRAKHLLTPDGWHALADGRGVAGEARPLPVSPALPSNFRIRVAPPGAASAEEWLLVDCLEYEGPHAAVAMLDDRRGELRFGDGRHGAALPNGAAVEVSYAMGGGAAGNLAAGSLDRFVATPRHAALIADWPALEPQLILAQPAPAAGGAEPETLAEARRRLARALALPARMVTPADVERHALALPGLPVARAYATPDVHPDFPGFAAIGVVTLVIVPSLIAGWRDPTPALLRALRLGLEPRRPLTMELHVAPPIWVPVAVTIELEASAGARPLVAEALVGWLEPFTGGADGGGWRPGATLYTAEAAAIVAREPGVDCIRSLSLRRPAGTAQCGALTLCPGELPVPGPLTLAIAEAEVSCEPRLSPSSCDTARSR